MRGKRLIGAGNINTPCEKHNEKIYRKMLIPAFLVTIC